MFCKKCGQELPDNTVVCPNCGERLSASQSKFNGTSQINNYVGNFMSNANALGNTKIYIFVNLGLLFLGMIFNVLKNISVTISMFGYSQSESFGAFALKSSSSSGNSAITIILIILLYLAVIALTALPLVLNKPYNMLTVFVSGAVSALTLICNLIAVIYWSSQFDPFDVGFSATGIFLILFALGSIAMSVLTYLDLKKCNKVQNTYNLF